MGERKIINFIADFANWQFDRAGLSSPSQSFLIRAFGSRAIIRPAFPWEALSATRRSRRDRGRRRFGRIPGPIWANASQEGVSVNRDYDKLVRF